MDLYERLLMKSRSIEVEFAFIRAWLYVRDLLPRNWKKSQAVSIVTKKFIYFLTGEIRLLMLYFLRWDDKRENVAYIIELK